MQELWTPPPSLLHPATDWSEADLRQKGAYREFLTYKVDGQFGGDYAQAVERDSLIDSIMDLDRQSDEVLRRLIVEESRLDILMRVLGYDVREHIIAIDDWIRGRRFALLLAPRGSGKSTAFDICDNILRALQNRNIRILIGSRTLEQASSFLSEIKGALQNENLVRLFGDLVGDKWDETQADIAGRTKRSKEHTFTASGADGAVVSKHFDVIKADDLCEEKNSRTEGQRELIIRYFYRSLMPCLRPGGSMWVIGTRYHPEELYGYLQTNDTNFGKSVFVMPAVFNAEGEATDLEQDAAGNWYVPIGSRIWDPVGYPEEELLTRRAGMPLADWETQFQNRTTALAGHVIHNEWIVEYDEEPHELVRKLDLSVWMGIDLAASLKASADEFAIVVLGITKSLGEYYVLHTIAGKYSLEQQFQLAVENFDEWDPVMTFVEANAYQAVFESTLRTEWPDIRTRPVYTTQDKMTRVRTMEIYFNRQRVYLRKGRMSKLHGQLTGFPEQKLKDLVDALYFCFAGALGGRARKKRKREPKLF